MSGTCTALSTRDESEELETEHMMEKTVNLS
jgi:hypothetical protein